MKEKGILYIAFGRVYDDAAAHAAAYSQKYTKLPFHVLTNVTERDRSSKWKEVKRVTFREFDMLDSENRHVKVRMNLYTPFKLTLYLDADSIIQRTGIGKIFELLKAVHMVLYVCEGYKKGGKMPGIYKRAADLFRASSPLTAYQGALVAFKKTPMIDMFFTRWFEFWSRFGKLREMPPLACAVQWAKKTGLKIKTVPRGFFQDTVANPKAVVQHFVPKGMPKGAVPSSFIRSTVIDGPPEQVRKDWGMVRWS